jgi:hypothetical protein
MSRLRGLLAFQFAFLAVGVVAASSAQADGYVVKRDTYVAPTWTGCYVGYDDGYKWGRTRFSTTPTYTLNNTAATVATPSTSGIDHLHTNGFLFGGQFGCNYQIRRDLVIGFEVSGMRDWGKDTATSTLTATVAAAPSTVATLTTETVRTCQIHIGPRVGTTLGGGTGLSAMVYGTGGYAGACHRTSQTGTFGLTGITNQSVSTDSFDNGWFLGTGVDIPTPFLLHHSFVQIEFTHSDCGSSSVALAGTATTGKVENTTNELRFGFKYRF